MLHNCKWSCKSQEMTRSKFLINNYMITEWKDIEPILVETKLEKR